MRSVVTFPIMFREYSVSHKVAVLPSSVPARSLLEVGMEYLIILTPEPAVIVTRTAADVDLTN